MCVPIYIYICVYIHIWLFIHTVLHQRKTYIPQNTVINLLDWSHVQVPLQSCSHNILQQSGTQGSGFGGPHCPSCVRAELSFSCSPQGRALHSTAPATTTQGVGNAISAGILQLSCWEHMLSHIATIPQALCSAFATHCTLSPCISRSHQRSPTCSSGAPAVWK